MQSMDDTARESLARWIASQLQRFSYSELKTIAVRVERLGRAISDYGNLDLATDRRVWKLEGAYEGVDRQWYEDAELVFNHDPAFADIREMRRLERIQRFIKADRHEAWESTFDLSDSETTGEWSPVSSLSNTESEESPIVNAAPSEPACVAPAHVEHSPTEGAAPILNRLDIECDDCKAAPNKPHYFGCSWTTVVPANDEVAL